MSTQTFTPCVRSYTKSELAHLYNPSQSQICALRTLKKWVETHPVLKEKLRETGINYADIRIFTPLQVELIFTYLGRP